MQISELSQRVLAPLPITPVCTPQEKFFAITSDGEARWLLPTHQSLEFLFTHWSPYRLSSRLKWQAIRAAQRVGALPFLPQAEAVDLPHAENIDWQAVGWRRSRPPTPVIYIGSPGPRRKAVIHLVDRHSGLCGAIVKVALTDSARDAIVREAQVLAALGSEHYPYAPRLLCLDRERGIASQDFLPGTQGVRRFVPEYRNLLQSLMLPDESTSLADHVAPWREEPLEFFPEAADLAVLGSALSELSDARPLPACWGHGDFAPWNIRHRKNGAAALVDWESAERGALPLQDFYHFHHTQDFLFGSNPLRHSGDAEFLANRLGISAQQSRTLEIAYLAQACLQSAARDERPRARHLLRALSAALAAGAPARPFRKPAHRLHVMPSRSNELAKVRAQILADVMNHLTSAGVPFCILSGHEPESAAASDVDVMFRTRDLAKLPVLLAEAARSAGAQLVQAIQHETTACYYVLVRQQGSRITHLDLDCYGDFRRNGQPWLRADETIENRRRYRDFFLPSVADEFGYYLVKKVLKQSICSSQLQKLQRLLLRRPVECRQRAVNLWPDGTALQLLQALMEQNLGWLRVQLPTLLAELQKTQQGERPVAGLAQLLGEARRIVRRIAHPTGLTVKILGGTPLQRAELANSLANNLRPAFRRVSQPRSIGGAWTQMRRLMAARARSTLVITTAENAGSASSVVSPKGLLKRLTRFVMAPDVVLQFSRPTPEANDRSVACSRRSRSFPLNCDDPTHQHLTDATASILKVLCERMDRRTKPAESAAGVKFSEGAEDIHSQPEAVSAGAD